MRYLFVLIFILLNTVLNAQIDTYHQIELNKGSKFIGKIVGETRQNYLLETNLIDTLYVKRTAVKRLYLIDNRSSSRGDIPILTRGFYKTFFMGTGTGSRRTNPKWLNATPVDFLLFSFFNTPSPQILVPQTTLLTVYKGNFSMGYQFNRYFGLGMGINIDALVQDEFLNGSVYFERANFNPYFQGKFNYPLQNWGNKDLWATFNVFRHTEVAAGLTFYSGKDVFMLGLGWYRSYFSFKTENYVSFQLGLQF